MISHQALQFERGPGLYRSQHYPELYAGTTGPALKKRKKIRKWINELQPQIIVNAGLVGILRREHPAQVGDRIKLGRLIDSRYRTIFPGGPGPWTLVGVTEPVFKPHRKIDVALDFDADACDMEAALLLSFAGQFDTLSDQITMICTKIVGDRPESYDLFQNEQLVRGWQHKSGWQKIKCGLGFPGGPWRLKRLLKQKEIALHALGLHTNRLLNSLIKHENINKSIDSIFIPH